MQSLNFLIPPRIYIIPGQFSIRPANQPGHIGRPTGAFSFANNNIEAGGFNSGVQFGTGGIGSIDYGFNANAGSATKNIYINNCGAVRPKSYGAYMYVRTS